MKKKIYLFSKLVLFATLISLIFSCEKDLYEDGIQQNHDKQINIKQISLEQFNSKLIQMKHKPEIEGLMVSSNSNSFQNRASSGTEFEIITDNIKEITQGDYTSYTMYVKTPDTTNSIYNITIEEVNDNTSVFLTKYEPSNNWTITSNRNFEGNIITYRISGITNDPVVLASLLTEAFEGLQEGGNNGAGAGSGGSSTSNSYPTDCIGTVQTTYLLEPHLCKTGTHMPWHACEYLNPSYINYNPSNGPYYELIPYYTCIPDYTPVDGDTPNPGDTPGGGTNTGNNNTGDTSLTTIVNPMGEECNAPRGDLNNDCMLDENEANFVTFLDNLTTQGRQIIVRNNTTKMNVFNYLVDQNWSNESEQFMNELIDYGVENNNSQESIEEINSILNLLTNNTPVIVGPDIPVTNMADYLSCFNTSQGATITIYADQPKANTHNLYSSNDGVGHAFFSIQQNNNIATLGFYPISSVGSLFGATPGIFGNDQNHTFDVSISTQISNTKLQEIIDLLISINNPIYDLHQYNCTDVAMTIANLSNISILSCESPSPWTGDTPGTLGEIIRDLPTPSNGSKNTTGGNSPFNNCN